jgi:hypothetical protein
MLDFTTASLDPRVTFTRSGATATRVNSSGYIETVAADTPRFDYDPITLAIRGLLIEQARTNFFVRSQEFDNAVSWATGARVTVVANAAVAPDGLATADSMTEVAVSGTHRLEQLVGSLTQTATYTISVYYKINSGAPYGLLFSSDASGNHSFRAWFDLTNGTVGSTQATGTGSVSGSTIENVGNGWYRCTATGSYGASGTPGVFSYVGMANADLSLSYAGDTGRSVYIWGAQFELGAFATSYIPTTTAALTRNADVATITGTNFSDFWQASKGGASVLATPSTVSGIRPLVQFDDNTADNIIALRGNTANPELQVVDVGAPQVQLDAGTIVANTPYSLTGWWQTNDCKARQNSGATVSDYTATIPTVTQARIGSDGTNYLNGTIATINYYDRFTGQIYDRRKNKAVFSLL